MKNRLLFCALIGTMMACQQEAAIQPDAPTLVADVVGTYHTNFYLDPSCVALSTDQMPYAELKAESDSTVTLIYTRLYPIKLSQSIEHVVVSRQPTGVQFHVAGSTIGTLQTDRIFTNNGMEKQGKLLRVNLQNSPENSLYFAGSR